VGFEASGAADPLRKELQATAALAFALALPGGGYPAQLTPGPTHSGCASGRAAAVTPAPEDSPPPDRQDEKALHEHARMQAVGRGAAD
jgi:hypothetical protein